MSLNKATIIGNLGDNPDIRTTKNGKEIARLRVATNQRYTDKEGKRQERTEWHSVVIFAEGLIENVIKPHLAKGKQVYLEGEIRTDSYDKNGVTHYRTELVADSLFLTGNKPKSD